MRIHTIALFLSVALLSCDEKEKNQSYGRGTKTLEVEAYKATARPFNNDVTTTADLLPNEQTSLMAPIAGQVLEIYFKEGEAIKKGDKIIRIYDYNWKAQLIGLTAELEVVNNDLKRKKALLDIEGSTQEEVDAVYSKSELLKSQIEELKLNIELANVRAPFSGVLGMRNFSKGAYLKQGDIITTITETSQLKVDFNLPQEYISSVSIDKKINVIINSDTLNATIYAINPIINSESRTINVRAMLKQQKGKNIMPGTFAEALITTNHIDAALLIPTQAVVPEINNQTVYVYQHGKAVRKTIQMGTRTSDSVHITQGISAGDTIITSALLQIKDGMDIHIQSIK